MSYPESINSPEEIVKLIRKKEFIQYNIKKQDDKIPFKSDTLILNSYQEFVGNIINPNTFYNRLLLKHSTGVGKTLAALNIAMNFIKYYQLEFNIKQADVTPMVYIIGFSKQVFLRELLRRPEFGFITKLEIEELKKLKHLADNGTQTEKQFLLEYEIKIKKRLTKKNKGGFFKFYGYKEFFNKLFIINESNEIVKENGKLKLNLDVVDGFRNSIIICDEIHNAYNSENMNNYGFALETILNIYEKQYDGLELNLDEMVLNKTRKEWIDNSCLKAVFMSGTPLNNSPKECVDLLNLLVPKIKLKKEDLFDDRNLKPDSLEKIRKFIRGYVSYLKDDNPKYFPERKFHGEYITIPKNLLKNRNKDYKETIIPYLKFIRCKMSSFHQKTYDSLFNTSTTLPPDGQSLLDMVLPNPNDKIGLYKSKDIKYALSNASNEWKKENKIEMHDDLITGDFMKLGNLEKYSTKYARMMEDIIRNLESDGGKIIINHQYVKMSGVLFIQEVLRQNNILDEYSSSTDNTLCSVCGKAKINHKDHNFIPARFIVYEGEIEKNVLEKSLDRFRSIDNKDGYLYRILIGSQIINESIDFNHVQNLYIMVCPTNYSTLIQIIGRAVRKNSHLELADDKKKVNIRIYTSTLNSDDNLSYEENKYFEKSQDYLIIQEIMKVFDEEAIDSIINRNIIYPEKVKEEKSLGNLYFEPSIKEITPDLTNLTSFRAFYSEKEIFIIINLIKELFKYQSIWQKQELWETVKDPPFNMEVNTKMFLYENFIIAVNSLIHNSFEAHININNINYRLVEIDDIYIIFPISNINESNDQLGINYKSMEGKIEIDYDNWFRKYNNFDTISLNITSYLKNFSKNYDQMKFKFYEIYKDYKIEELPISMEIYDNEFHTKLAEDSIIYCFNILTNPDMNISELHDFYFKMLYFYDRLDLILFANNIEEINAFENYRKYIDPNAKQDNHNNFLMSSIIKSSNQISFNIDNLNEYIGRYPNGKNIVKLNNVRINVPKNTNIRKVKINLLPVGHLFNINEYISIPKLYNPDIGWEKNYELTNVSKDVEENDYIVGYYEKNQNSIDIKFKLRLPIQKIKKHKDVRMIERGSVCTTRKKEELLDIVKNLKIGKDLTNYNIKDICNEIKLFLLHKEIYNRRLAKHGEKHLKYFYLHYEKQPI